MLFADTMWEQFNLLKIFSERWFSHLQDTNVKKYFSYVKKNLHIELEPIYSKYKKSARSVMCCSFDFFHIKTNNG